jgi:uncharacterized membrane protein
MWYTYLMAFLMGLAGVNHFVKPKFYLSITPAYLPFPKEINMLAGVVQLLLCAGLIYPPTRVWSAYLIISMLVVFLFTIHIVHFFDTPKMLVGKTHLLIIRVLLQFVFIWWAWMIAKNAMAEGL